MYQDKNMDWARQRLVLEASDLNALGANGTGLANIPGTLGEVNSLGFWGIDMAKAGETIVHSFKAPDTWDFNREIGVTIEWSSGSTTTADDVHWIARFKAIGLGEAITGPAETDTLDTAIAAETIGADATAYGLRNSPRGIIDAGAAGIKRGDRLVISVEADVADPATLFLHAIIFDFMPKLTRGPGARNDRHYEDTQIDWKY